MNKQFEILQTIKGSPYLFPVVASSSEFIRSSFTSVGIFITCIVLSWTSRFLLDLLGLTMSQSPTARDQQLSKFDSMDPVEMCALSCV